MDQIRVISVQIGLPLSFAGTAPGPNEKAWSSGIRKAPVQGRIWLGSTNLAGDGQGDLVNHGGPDKAVNVYAGEYYADWQREFGQVAWGPGSFGENFTTLGLSEDTTCIGDVYTVGEAILQVSQPRQPCWKLDRRWGLPNFAERVRASGRTGWYLRVLREGYVEAGLPMPLVEQPYPQWTITLVNDVILQRLTDRETISGLANCPLLAGSLRSYLAQRPVR